MPRKRTQQTDAEAQTVLAQLERVIRWDDKFRLVFVKCNSPLQQDEMRRMLLARLSDKQVLEVFLQKPIVSLLDELTTRWDAAQPPEAVCVYGLEKSINEQREASPVLGRLNHDRDLLRQAIPAALLIWLPDFALDCVARGAPDFWAWRSGVYEFPTEVALWQRDSISALAHDVPALFSLPLEDKQKEIARLEELVRTARVLPRQGKREQETISHLVYQLGLLYDSLGEWDIARTQFEESLEIAQRLGNQYIIAARLHALGVLAQKRGQLEEAEQWYRQSLAIKERLGKPQGQATTLHQLGSIAQERGQLEEAEQWYRQSLAIKEHLSDEHGRAGTLHQLGMIAEERGNIAEAVRFFQQAGALFERLGHSHSLDIVRASLQRVRDDSPSRN